MQSLASIPSPSEGVWNLGPFPLRAYALMIIIGVVIAVWLGEKRWAAKGGTPGTVIDVAVWAVPFGLVGGRLYHVITDHQMYFGEGKHPIDALKVWHGGLGIWGAVALGALGAWIGCRQRGVRLAPFGDAIAPGIAIAQGIGRWGNWWNQELYGKPTTLPWGLEIDYAHRPKDELGAVLPQYDKADLLFHPTFLYESLWCLGLAVLVIWAGRRFRLNHGRTFALYVAGYTVGRFWIEALRIDNAHSFLGLRLNDYTAIIVFLGAAAYLYLKRDQSDVPEVVEVRDGVEIFDQTGAVAAPVLGTDESVESVESDEPDEPAEPVESVAPVVAEPVEEPLEEEYPESGGEPVAEEEPILEEEPAVEHEPVTETESITEIERDPEPEFEEFEPEAVAVDPLGEDEPVWWDNKTPTAEEPESAEEAVPEDLPEDGPDSVKSGKGEA
ncbi:MAG: prolipoprotein diacylglyceryl transferase [Streptosporangiaceae bacterium]